ncbi:MAG TPA: aminotransferase class V-fold PLP-dependent enzyme [Thermoanaerobaculia bacterium]|jgi:selenocysteine lyase/cysteine desulfurase
MRELFPVTRNLIYFNNAAVGPLSVRAHEAMARHASDQRDYGALHWREWDAEVARLREAAATLIGATPAEVSILKNTSEGLSFVAGGLRWEEGDNIVTTAYEFPSNWAPWKRLEARGVEVRVAATPAADDLERLIDGRTKLVTLSSVAFHNGFAADLIAIGELCERRNALFCVDGIQSVGVLPLDVRAAKISFFSADGHKWLCGPEGATIFYVAAEHRDKLEVLEHGWLNVQRKGRFIDCGLELHDDGRRFEAGSLNTNGIYGLRAAIDLLLEVGIDAIRDRVLTLANRLADGLAGEGFVIGSPRPVASGIVGATPPDVESRSTLWYHRKLEEATIVCSPREGMLRFSPHFYNDESEVDRVLEVVRFTMKA